MGRTLGIPTRVAVGFLPGTVQPNGGGFTYVVTGKQAHDKRQSIKDRDWQRQRARLLSHRR